ncbi:MAG: uracil-DNA glycosylase family protein [Saprospiraceae bacterium]
MRQLFITAVFFQCCQWLFVIREGDFRRPCQRPECAPLWHPEIFKYFSKKPLILLIGHYAQRYYLKENFKGSLTETVSNCAEYLPANFPLPHPSPRNQNRLTINSWFMEEANF